MIYVNVESPNLGFPYFNFLGGYQLKKHPISIYPYIGKGEEALKSSRAKPDTGSV